MTKGEEVQVLVDYDLFETNIKDEIGIYLSTAKTTGKHLIYFPVNEEWAELTDDQISRVATGKVSKKNKEFSDRVKTMVVTYGV